MTDAATLTLLDPAALEPLRTLALPRAGLDNLLPRQFLIATVRAERLAPAVLRGKQLCHDAADLRMARDRYLGCAVCHMDGGGDGRVWDFAHRGEGLRHTPSLLGRGGLLQGPLHWSANFDEVQDFEHDIREAFGGSGYLDSARLAGGPLGPPKAGLSPELDALAAYLATLDRARPSPWRNPDGTPTAAGERGRAVFHRADVGCAACHAPPRYTDYRLPAPGSAPATPSAPGDWVSPQGFLLHDVGTLKPTSGRRLDDTLKGLDTPSLLGLWENPPSCTTAPRPP